jgi:hypothetical protein
VRLRDPAPVHRALDRRTDPAAPEPTHAQVAALRRIVDAALG